MHKSTQVSSQSIVGKMAPFETSWCQYGFFFVFMSTRNIQSKERSSFLELRTVCEEELC